MVAARRAQLPQECPKTLRESDFRLFGDGAVSFDTEILGIYGLASDWLFAFVERASNANRMLWLGGWLL